MQPSYRSLPPSAPGSVPRRPPMMPQQQQPHQQQQQQQAVAAAQHHVQAQHQDAMHQRQLVERAKIRSEKPADRNLPEGIDDLVLDPDVALHYRRLRDIERRLDASMMRKRLDIQDGHGRLPKQYGTLRLWVSNTVEDQPWQLTSLETDAFDFSSNVEAKFRVKIQGRLLETPEQDEDQSVPNSARSDEEPLSKRQKFNAVNEQRKKLSHFFKSITIDFDRLSALQPDGYTQIEWKRPETNMALGDLPKDADFDTLEFERKADENISITIRMVRDEHPEKYRLAPPLAELLDMQEADRQTVLMGIWEYVKGANLHQDAEGRQVRCDSRLQKALGVDSFFFPALPDRLRQHLLDRPPITLQYTIRVDRDFHTKSGSPEPTVYDIPVPLDDPLTAKMRAIVNSPLHKDHLNAISAVDAELALNVQAINQARAKHGFFTSMSDDPAIFVRRWLSSQKRDSDVLRGAGSWGEDDWQEERWRMGGANGAWGTTDALEGVGWWLSRRDAQRT